MQVYNVKYNLADIQRNWHMYENTFETNGILTGKKFEINRIILKWARHCNQAALTMKGSGSTATNAS